MYNLIYLYKKKLSNQNNVTQENRGITKKKLSIKIYTHTYVYT